MSRSEVEYTRRILQEIATGERVTQRTIAARMDVALGLINLLIRRLVRKGYVKVSKVHPRQLRYVVTPAGWQALAEATRQSIAQTVQLYTETREHIGSSLATVSRRCAVTPDGRKPIVFCGAGDVAEIAYVSLQRTDLALVGIVDSVRTGRFFHLEIASLDKLSRDAFDGQPYSQVVVTTLHDTDAVCRALAGRDVPADRVFCL